MSLIINNNLMAMNAARNLGDHYGKLSVSVRRLSSGLRVGQASDDAAGLAIRELMRADIRALNQGIRNANDAISLIQTADGALQIIDEKLIRMKELAEQAATGTYNSDQRMMIHDEFIAMADEIDRIIAATDFNGIKLLDGTLDGTHDGSGLAALGALKVHFGPGNNEAEDYYYINIAGMSAHSLIMGGDPGAALAQDFLESIGINWPGATLDGNKLTYNVDRVLAGTGSLAASGLPGQDIYYLPPGLQNVTIRASGRSMAAHKSHVNLFTKYGEQLTGVNPDLPNGLGTNQHGSNWWSSPLRDHDVHGCD